MEERTLEWVFKKTVGPRGKPPKRWAGVFVEKLDQLSNQLDMVLEDRNGSREGLKAQKDFFAILDDNSEGTKRMEQMLKPTHFLRTGYLNI